MKTHILTPDGGKIAVEPQIRTPTRDEFRKQMGWNASRKLEVASFLPCLQMGCAGSGWIYDPNDPPCPVEGNKLRDRIKCPECQGTGETTPKKFNAAFQAEKARIKAENARRAATANAAKVGLKKLATHEWQAIRRLAKI